ncbi:MAG TPA: hypothetical protein VJ743_11525 [Albitalea sp.]|nr:hypothetical protein [Albitalea sp.]
MSDRPWPIAAYAVQSALLAAAAVVVFFPRARIALLPAAFWLLFWLELVVFGARILHRGHLRTDPAHFFARLRSPGGEHHRITTGTLERAALGAAFAAAAVMLFA